MTDEVLREGVVGGAIDMPALVSWRYGLDLTAGPGGRLGAVMVNKSIDAPALSLAGGDALFELMCRARQRRDGVRTEVGCVGLLGKPQVAIPVSCSERDLLVVGPHGHSVVSRMLFGSARE